MENLTNKSSRTRSGERSNAHCLPFVQIDSLCPVIVTRVKKKVKKIAPFHLELIIMYGFPFSILLRHIFLIVSELNEKPMVLNLNFQLTGNASSRFHVQL